MVIEISLVVQPSPEHFYLDAHCHIKLTLVQKEPFLSFLISKPILPRVFFMQTTNSAILLVSLIELPYSFPSSSNLTLSWSRNLVVCLIFLLKQLSELPPTLSSNTALCQPSFFPTGATEVASPFFSLTFPSLDSRLQSEWPCQHVSTLNFIISILPLTPSLIVQCPQQDLSLPPAPVRHPSPSPQRNTTPELYLPATQLWHTFRNLQMLSLCLGCFSIW